MLRDVRSDLAVLTPEDGWERCALAGVPAFEQTDIAGTDPYDSDEYLLLSSGFTEPDTLRRGEIGGEPETLKQAPAFFDAAWMAEYGDPREQADWFYLRPFSPYHNVSASGHYPPALFITSTRDDRVHPGHARKMVARLRESAHEVSYYENIEGGHGAAADNEQRAFKWALVFEFLWEQLAPEQGAGSSDPVKPGDVARG